MNAQIRNLIVLFAVMKWANTLDQNDPRMILGARTAYLSFLLVALGLNLWMMRRVKTLGDGRTITVPKKPTLSNPTPSANDVDRLQVEQYDLSLLSAARNQLLTQTLFLMLIHWKMGSITPLILQATMGFFRQFDDPMVKIHVLGNAATGALERPFKPEPNPLAQLLGRGLLTTPTASTPPEQQTIRDGDSNGVSSSARLSSERNNEPRENARVTELPDVTDSSGDEAAVPDEDDASSTEVGDGESHSKGKKKTD